MGKYAPVIDLVFAVVLTLLGMAGFTLFGISTWRRAAATITLLVIALGLFAFLILARVQGIEREGRHRAVVVSLRGKIAGLLREGEEIRLRIYRLCDPTDRRGLHKGPHAEVGCWRKGVADFLAGHLPGSDANDRFQRMNLPYDHRQCGQVEWVQRWLSDLMANLTAVSNELPQYVQDSEAVMGREVTGGNGGRTGR